MEERIRINKYLSEAGFCSRREADRLVEAGKVTIDGAVASAGDKVAKGQCVCVSGRRVDKKEPFIFIALNKPVGIVCNAALDCKDNIIRFLDFPYRIYPAGRLDKNSEGLLLLTNQGDWVNKMMRAGNYHEKEYVVTVDKPLTKDFLRGMSGGVPILGTVTRPCKVNYISKNTFNIILTQGLNRQIRRMCEYFGYKVVKLKRVRIMNIQLGSLKTGQWRYLTEEELAKLKKMIRHSSNMPEKERRIKN